MILIVVIETGFKVTIHPLTTNSFTVISEQDYVKEIC